MRANACASDVGTCDEVNGSLAAFFLAYLAGDLHALAALEPTPADGGRLTLDAQSLP